MRSRRRLFVLTSAAITATVAAGGITTAMVASAGAAGCRVDYTVSSQWRGGFAANTKVVNLGDPITKWSLTWTYPSGQRVSGAWRATVTQSGTKVTAVGGGRSRSLRTNKSVTFGVVGTSSKANAAPTSFALNGVTCTGSVKPTAAPTATRTKTPTTPTAAPPSSRPASPAPSQPSTPRPTSTSSTSPPASSGWNPPANLVSPLNQVWQHVEQTHASMLSFRNFGWDQIIANKGSINYCVRWDSSATVSAAQRDQIHAQLARQFKKWTDTMVGHNAWPYREVPLKVVGWAVRDRAQLQWSDDSVKIYVNDIRENAPQCAEPCGRFFHQDGKYPGCPGGAAAHYDMSLWLTAGMGGGAGGDWGQRIGSEYLLSNLSADNVHILLHEIGHSFGLDDFYDWTPTGVGGFVMKAGSATKVTDFDMWMYRDWWRHIKSRYGY